MNTSITPTAGPAPADLRESSYAPTPWRKLLPVMLVVILPLIALSQFIAYWRVDVVDDQMFGYFGWRIAHGATVYVHVWDNKPPGIYWINALGMLVGADSYFGVMGMCVAALLAAHACFFAICNSLYFRGAAAFATILLAFFLTHGYYTGGTNRTETFLVACELAAVLWYVRGFASDRWWKWLLAGVFCGMAFLFKQVGLAAFAALGLHLLFLVIIRRLGFLAAVRRGLLMVVGLGALLGVAGLYLAWQHALGEALNAVFGFNRAYFNAGYTEWPYSYKNLKLMENHFFPILLLPLLMAAAAGLHALLWAVRPRFRPPEIERPLKALGPVCPGYMVLFAVWFLISLWGALVSPSAYRHYLVPAIPPLLLMAGYLLNVLQAEMKLLVRMQQRAWVTAGFVAIAYFSIEALQRQWEEFSQVYIFRFVQHERAQWEVVGDAVARVTGPQDKIQCWGYLPGVYLGARRVNTCRFTTTEKFGQVPKDANFVLRELEQKVRAEPPVALAMPASDYFGMHHDDPSKPAPPLVLGPWIDEHYERLADVPYFNIYIFKLKDRVQPQDRDLQQYVERTARR